MKWLLLAIMALGSLSFADDSPKEPFLGVIRILNTKPVEYDPHSGAAIPNSQHTLLRVKEIRFNQKNPGLVALMMQTGSFYEALVVKFDTSEKFNTVPKTFGKFLHQHGRFVMDVRQEDLRLDTSIFLSVLVIDAEDLLIFRPADKKFVHLGTLLCPERKTNSWWGWGKKRTAREDCL